MKRLYESYAYCPRCGAAYEAAHFDPADVVFHCNSCRYDFYQNSIPSATGVVPWKDQPSRVLLIRRGTPPAMGKLALPGGILRYGEAAADGARREVREETHLDIGVERLLCSTLVDYEYRGMRVCILELAFQMTAADRSQAGTSSEASEIGFYEVEEALRDRDKLAFPEQVAALQAYHQLLSQPANTSGSLRRQEEGV